jgi:hypothetical protein
MGPTHAQEVWDVITRMWLQWSIYSLLAPGLFTTTGVSMSCSVLDFLSISV